jgi:hypothetical protein
MSSFVLGQVLVFQGVVQPQATVALIQELWSVVTRTQSLGPGVGQIMNALYMMQRLRNQFDPTLYELMTQYGTEFLDQTHGVYQGKHKSYIAIFFDIFIICDYEITQRVRKTEIVQKYLQAALEKKDEEATQFILDTLQSMRGLRFEPRYRPSLRINIEPLLHCEGDVQAEIIKLLALWRSYQPDIIDGYMAEQQLPEQVVNEVTSAGATENIVGDIMWGSVNLGLGDTFSYFCTDEELRSSFVIPVLERVAEVETLHAWLVYIIKTSVNAVYGKTLFQI